MDKILYKTVISFFIALLFSQCVLQKNSTSELMMTTYEFVKAIRTKDDKLFSHVVYEDSLKKSLLALYDDTVLLCKDRQVCMDVVNGMCVKEYYFFMYGPLKIRSHDLEALQKNNFPFEQLNFKLISTDANRAVFIVEGSLQGNSFHSITIALRKFRSNWKVVSAIPFSQLEELR